MHFHHGKLFSTTAITGSNYGPKPKALTQQRLHKTLVLCLSHGIDFTIAAFEKVVRQVLINEKADSSSVFATKLANADVEKWTLPYWDYRTPETSALPPRLS